MVEINYPTVEHIIEFNHLALALVRVKKADKPAVLSKPKLHEIVEECQNAPSDVYDKAVVLLTGIIKKHPFASGNRRTAFAVAMEFLLVNSASTPLLVKQKSEKVLLGIRESYYSNEEISEWLKTGEIRAFKR